MFLHTCQLSKALVHKYHITIFSKKISYSLSVSYFSKKQFRKMQRPYHRALLEGLGFNKKTATQVCYGSRTLAGIGIKCLYMEQGIQCTLNFIRHWRDTSQISRLLKITMAWTQHSAGAGIPILEDDR